MKTLAHLIICSPLLLAAIAHADTDWVQESNAHAMPVLQLLAKYQPETAGSLGVDGYDEAILDLGPNRIERQAHDASQLQAKLAAHLKQTQHPKVKQDLQILIQTLEDQRKTDELERQLMLPYFDVAETIFSGIRALLDPRVDKSRHPAAVVRLMKYTGESPGREALTDLAKARTIEHFQEEQLIGPYRGELKKDLANSEGYLAGIAELMRTYELAGWEDAHKTLSEQIKSYGQWIRAELIPRARSDHRLPAELYADQLKNYGVDLNPQELMERANFGFVEIRSEMQAMAKRIAAQHGWDNDDYRNVIRELKKEQLSVDDLLPVYRQRLKAIESIIRREKIVSLPHREARIRFATAAESARAPAPHMRPPRLIGNTGEYGEFVLPLRNPNAESDELMDDFLHDGITWSLTAHEARPGHELQFSAIVENGISIPRAIFAFNSVNVEGWGMYAEAIVKEHLPLEGQFFTLYARLVRAARAFLDPMLNLGQLEPDQAKAFLVQELVLSEPMATQEIDRYTFRAPGQATSYYYGLMKLEALRLQTELRLGNGFNQQSFHDFILAQGLLPPDLLTQAVLEEFVPQSQTPQQPDGPLASPPLSFEGARAEVYKTVGDVRLYLYIFEPRRDDRTDERPAAVFFFGGGWTGGSPQQFEPHCRYLASRGMVAMVADYRVERRHGTSPFECVKDGKSAVRWIRANAERLGIDLQRIAAGGGSAGGHVAAATGNVPGLEEANEDTSISSQPNALLLFNPVYDNGPDGFGYARVGDRYQEISPLHNIHPGAPPTIVFLGTNDKLIPVSTAEAYEAKMKSCGSRCDTHLYEDQVHGFFNKGRNGDKFYQATVLAMDKFLISLDWLKGEPTIQAVP